MSWFKNLKYPKDLDFKKRKVLGVFAEKYLVVTVSAAVMVGLHDQLYKLSRELKDDNEAFSYQFMALKYRALAFSLRTRCGRIPFDANNPETFQATFEYLMRFDTADLEHVFKLIIQGSKLDFLFPELSNKPKKETVNETVEIDEDPTNP